MLVENRCTDADQDDAADDFCTHANAEVPEGNSVAISTRAYRKMI